MNFWWKLALFAAFLAANDAIVWRVHTWRDGFKETKALQAEQQATKQAMQASNAIDTSFAASSAHIRQLEESANQKLEAIHENPSANCRIDAQRLSILRAAIAANPATR